MKHLPFLLLLLGFGGCVLPDRADIYPNDDDSAVSNDDDSTVSDDDDSAGSDGVDR